MKELFEFIWNMPLTMALIIIGILLIPVMLFIAFVFVGMMKGQKRFNRMDRDFENMRKRVRSNLRQK